MSIDVTIAQYRETKNKMQAIIDRHMGEAFAEIKQEFSTTPTSVYIKTADHQTVCSKYPSGVYVGCEVTLPG